MNLLIVAAAIGLLIVFVTWGKVHAFLAFVLVSIGAALALGVPAPQVADAIRKGIGDILGSLLIVIVSGAMLGKLVVDSGAAQRIAMVMVDCCGRKRLGWAMALTGFIVGIPLFYGVGFMLLVPIIFTVVARYRLSAIAVGMPALAALSVAHGLLPPHPGPTALVALFHADMGRTLLYGLLIAVPAIIIAGPMFARTLGGIVSKPLESLAATVLPPESLPGTFTSIATALLPAILLAGTTLTGVLLINCGVPSDSPVASAVKFISDRDTVMLLTLLVATVTLGIGRGKSVASVMQSFATAGTDVASILLIIAGSGAFKQVLVTSGVDAQIANAMGEMPLHPLVLAWLVTAVIRACIGSATVAGLTAAGLLVPLMSTANGVAGSSGIDPNFMVLAIGAGSLAFSHVNDAAFWLFKEYFNVSMIDTLRCWTVMETLVSIVGLAGVLILDWLI